MIPVSVVVMTRNEAANLPSCLASLDRFAEVFVVDSASTDGTPEIALRHRRTLVPFHWDGAYPKKKQWCLDRLPFRHDWVLFVDADERPTAELADEIAVVLQRGPRHAGYYVKGRPVFLGRTLRFGAWNRKLALFDRHRVRFPVIDDLDVAAMWEVEGHYQPVVDGTIGQLRGHVLHDDAKPMAAWFDRHNRYSDWEAVLRTTGRMSAVIAHETPGRRRLKRIFDRTPWRPVAVFLHAYVARLGVLDGRAGLHHAFARAVYYWQVQVKMAALRHSAGASASRSPPSALTRSNVRLRTDGSPIR